MRPIIVGSLVEEWMLFKLIFTEDVSGDVHCFHVSQVMDQ